MAKLLVLHNNKISFSKGDIIEVRANNGVLSDTEKLDFIVVKIPDLLMSGLDQYKKVWNLEVDYEIIIHQTSTDGYRIKISGINVDSSGNGKITQAKVENYLSSWNGLLHSSADNEVIIDVGTYEIATSNNFWKRDDLSEVIFNHDSYDQNNGIHVISADYSYYNWSPTAVERKIERLGITILSHVNKIITYQIQGTGNPGVHNGNHSLMKLKEDIDNKVKELIKRSRYYFLDAIINQAISNNYEITLTEAELISEIKDKFLD